MRDAWKFGIEQAESESKMRIIQLTVAEAISNDVGKGVIRLDAPFMNAFEVEEGDIVVIEGSSIAYAKAVRAYPGDSNIPLTRIEKNF